MNSGSECLAQEHHPLDDLLGNEDEREILQFQLRKWFVNTMQQTATSLVAWLVNSFYLGIVNAHYPFIFLHGGPRNISTSD